ncbi:MAG: iron chelate uptake ABC transporter family permease subunit, partial [Solibacillus sp.]
KGLVGNDYRWTLPFSALLGAALLIGADILARFLISPMEVPIGVMTALIGGPFFIYLAKKGVSKQ